MPEGAGSAVLGGAVEWLDANLASHFPSASYDAPLGPGGMGCRLTGIDLTLPLVGAVLSLRNCVTEE